MINKSKLTAKGKVTLQLFDENGVLKNEQHVTNVVVDNGVDYIADRMNSNGTTIMSHMAVGDDATAASVTDTGLINELGRVSLTSAVVTDNSIQYIGDFGAGTGTGAVTEAGILNNSSGGTLLCRTVFAVVNKGASDTLKITWTVTVSDS